MKLSKAAARHCETCLVLLHSHLLAWSVGFAVCVLHVHMLLLAVHVL
jgi:hypothetical protein